MAGIMGRTCWTGSTILTRLRQATHPPATTQREYVMRIVESCQRIDVLHQGLVGVWRRLPEGAATAQDRLSSHALTSDPPAGQPDVNTRPYVAAATAVDFVPDLDDVRPMFSSSRGFPWLSTSSCRRPPVRSARAKWRGCPIQAQSEPARGGGHPPPVWPWHA